MSDPVEREGGFSITEWSTEVREKRAASDEALRALEQSSSASTSVDVKIMATGSTLASVFEEGRLYLIEPTAVGWHLRRLLTGLVMQTGASPEELKSHAFVRLRGFAPCKLRVLTSPMEEWQLSDLDGNWRRTE